MSTIIRALREDPGFAAAGAPSPGSSTTSAKSPSKKCSAASMTSLYFLRAARAWAAVAPYGTVNDRRQQDKMPSYHFHKLLHLAIHGD